MKTNDFWPEKLQDDIGYGIEEEFHFLEKKKLFYCGIVKKMWSKYFFVALKITFSDNLLKLF